MSAPAGLDTAARLDGLGLSQIRAIAALAGPEAISLAVGQVDAMVPAVLLRAVTDAPSRRDGRYGPNAGQPELRALIAQEYGVAPARVIVTTGVQQALSLALFGVVNAGDDVLVPDPGFPTYATLARLAGGRSVGYRLREEDGFRTTLAALEEALTEATRVVVLASPSNPTGAVNTPDEWASIVSWARTRGLWVVSDEIYAAFAGADAHGSALELWDDALVARGLSKSHAIAGWRCGWLIVPERFAGRFVGLQQNLVTCASSLVQDAATVAFTPSGKHAALSITTTVARRQAQMVEGLREDGWTVAGSEAGLFVWAKWPGIDDCLAFAKACATEFGVVVVPGSGFGEGGRGWVRVSCGAIDDHLAIGRQRLTEAARAYSARSA